MKRITILLAVFAMIVAPRVSFGQEDNEDYVYTGKDIDEDVIIYGCTDECDPTCDEYTGDLCQCYGICGGCNDCTCDVSLCGPCEGPNYEACRCDFDCDGEDNEECPEGYDDCGDCGGSNFSGCQDEDDNTNTELNHEQCGGIVCNGFKRDEDWKRCLIRIYGTNCYCSQSGEYKGEQLQSMLAMSDCDAECPPGEEKDECGVCGGDNGTCAGCDGVPNSGRVYDDCGECDGDNSTCSGCDGVPNSGKVPDDCGVCDGDNSTCNPDPDPDPDNDPCEGQSPDVGCGCGEPAAKIYYYDADNDGVGGSQTENYCEGKEPAQWVSITGDCDDTKKEVQRLNTCGKCDPQNLCSDCPKGQAKDVNDKCVECAQKDDDGVCVPCSSAEKRNSKGVCEKDCDTSKEDLKKAFSSISDANASKLSDVLNEKGKDFGIDTDSKMQHFLSQAAHETGGFGKLTSTESTYYSTASRLEEIWPSRFSQTDDSKKDPDDYIKNSSKLANFVYANRLGNGNEASGDGYKYRGRGLFQLTGKSNYQSFTDAYNAKYEPDKDFVANPDLLASDNEIAIISALWFYQNNVLNKITVNAETTVKNVTNKINGGTIGLSDRQAKFTSAKENIDCD